MSKATFEIRNRIQPKTPAESLISPDLLEKVNNQQENIVQIPVQEDIDHLENGKYKPENISEERKVISEEKVEQQEKVEKKKIVKQTRKDGKIDKRYKEEEEKLNRPFPLNLKKGLYDDLELISKYQVKSINLLINEIIEKGIDQEILKKYKEIEESLRK